MTEYQLSKETFIETWIPNGKRDRYYRNKFNRLMPIPKDLHVSNIVKDDIGRVWIEITDIKHLYANDNLKKYSMYEIAQKLEDGNL